MLTKEQEQRQAIEMLCTDMLVPEDHLLRKIDAAVDFKHIYEIVEDLYCEDNGRPSCDPVVLFKLDMIKHLFGIPSRSVWGDMVHQLYKEYGVYYYCKSIEFNGVKLYDLEVIYDLTLEILRGKPD